MFGSLLSITNRASGRIVARALVSNSPPIWSSRAAAASATSRLVSNTSSRLGAPIEEEIDLDAALDDVFASAGQEKKLSIPAERLQEDFPTTDFTDPEFLNTKNPSWLQAGLEPSVIDVLSAKGITHFTPVQGEAFHPVLARRDVIGRSRTGTGKTLAFGLPALTRLVQLTEEEKGTRIRGRMQRGRNVSMLVLCPTRELARQVQEELAEIAKPLNLQTSVFHGGVSYEPQSKALSSGIDVLVGTPGRIIDHLERGTLDLSECDLVVLDEADEMLNMGFADDVEVILEGLGSENPQKAQCLLFSATTPSWVKQIGRRYQQDVVSIDSTGDEGGARVATTVRHLAVQVPPGLDSKKAVLEDIIAVEISRETKDDENDGEENDPTHDNPIAAAALEQKKKGNHAMQQKIFGKTIVFTQTKKDADELVSAGVFKSLTAQAIHGDVSQRQRDATLNAFRDGAFNVLVATDVAARGIDIKDVDLIVQLDPPRDADTYVHRSGRTGRAGNTGVSVLLFHSKQARDIVKIERDLGHGFRFDLVGPPSTEAALQAAARTSANACMTISDDIAAHFKDAAKSLLEDETPEDIIARCLAAISRRSTTVQSRSLITGEVGLATVEMSHSNTNRYLDSRDVMATVGKLSRMSEQQNTDIMFSSEVGKIQTQDNTAVFDMSVDDAKNLIEFTKDFDAGGASFRILHELEVKRDRFFGKDRFHNSSRGGNNRGGRFSNNNRNYNSRRGDSWFGNESVRNNSRYNNEGGRNNGRYSDGGGGGGGGRFNNRYDGPQNDGGRYNDNGRGRSRGQGRRYDSPRRNNRW